VGRLALIPTLPALEPRQGSDGRPRLLLSQTHS